MSSGAGRPGARRLPSTGWSRLRAPPTDALESYGLVSKGDTRLNDPKLQEAYYKKIVERYVRFCASVEGGDGLEQAFTSLSVSDKPSGRPQQTPTAGADKPPEPVKAQAHKTELETILMAMRKLRESITAVHRTDTFAQRAYVFIVHASILTRHWQSYQPALSYLVYQIHPVTPLPETELREMAGFIVLDLACRQKEYTKAYSCRRTWRVADRRVDKVLKALVLEDWVLFWNVKQRVDGLQRALMEWAEDDVRMHALKCLGKSYLSADKAFIERAAGKSWADLVKDGIGWELGSRDLVTIRRVGPKA